MNTYVSSSKNSAAADPKSNVPVILPYWDDTEINRRLDEHSKLLAEWDELLTRTGAPEITSISQHDAQRHIYLKRKLHESLGVMARIVQNQLKNKKMASDGTTPGGAPVMVTGGYAPMSSGNPSLTGMHLPSVNFQQGGIVDYNQTMSQPITGQNMAYNTSYNYQNGFVPAHSGGNTYSYYNPQMTQGSQPMHTQPISTQNMYVPQYQAMSTANVAAHNSQGIAAGTDNRNTGNTYSGMTYAAPYTAPMSYSSNTMQGATAQGQGMQMQQNVPGQVQNPAPPLQMGNTSSYTYGNSNAAPTYGTSTDGPAMMFSQQLLQQVPTSYYGNSSVPTSTAAMQAAPLANSQYNTHSQNQSQPQGQQGQMQSHVPNQMQGRMPGQQMQVQQMQGQPPSQGQMHGQPQGMVQGGLVYTQPGQQGQQVQQQQQYQQYQQAPQGQRGAAPSYTASSYDPAKDKQ